MPRDLLRVILKEGTAPMYMPKAVTMQAEIDAAVQDIASRLRPDVERIRYDIEQDWSGDWGIFFRVTLSDDASSPRRLREVASKVVERMSERLDFPSFGVFDYYNFRSVAEQKRVA
jgi:hypothetical protein